MLGDLLIWPVNDFKYVWVTQFAKTDVKQNIKTNKMKQNDGKHSNLFSHWVAM